MTVIVVVFLYFNPWETTPWKRDGVHIFIGNRQTHVTSPAVNEDTSIHRQHWLMTNQRMVSKGITTWVGEFT